MPKYSDATGRVWNPRVTVRTLELFESETGKSLDQLGDVLSAGKIGDICMLAFHACRAETKERKVNYDDFLSALESKDQLEAMVRAVGEACVAFSQSRESLAAISEPK